MILLVVVLVVVVIVLGVMTMRLRSQTEALDALAAERAVARDQARAEAGAATARADAADRERDAALERAARARRDAAEVARRLQDEATARSEAEVRAEEARAVADAAEVALQSAQERSAGGGGGDDAGFLWGVALAQVERLWQVSVAPVPDEASPLEGTDDPLRVAAEIVVDAAREEAGAPVELSWEGGPPVAAPTALVALAVVQEIVGAVAKGAESADIAVRVDDDAVSIAVEAVGARDLSARIAPGLAVGADRWCVARR